MKQWTLAETLLPTTSNQVDMKYYILLFFAILFSCNQGVVTYPPNSIEVIFHKPGIYYPMRLGCGWPKNVDSIGENFSYKRICDKKTVDRFLKVYRLLEVDSTDHSTDVRIHILIHQSIKTDTLCLGENFGVEKNGQPMKDSRELLQFIKSAIYD